MGVKITLTEFRPSLQIEITKICIDAQVHSRDYSIRGVFSDNYYIDCQFERKSIYYAAYINMI